MSKKENCLLIGLDGRRRERSLDEKRQIRLVRKQNIKSLRAIGLNKKIAGELTSILERSGCSLQEQRIIMKHFKKLLIDFKRDLHGNLELGRINLNRLPLSLRRLIIALIVLKAEIAHLFRLNQEKQRAIREKNNTSNISISDYGLGFYKDDLNLDNHKLYRAGVSLSKGNYEGMRDFSKETKSKQNNFYKKKMNFNFDITKNTKNKTEERQRRTERYFGNRMDVDDWNDVNMNNFSKTSINQKSSE